MKSPAFKYAIIAIVTVGLLYLAFRGQDVGASFAAMRSARFIPLLGGLIVMFLSHGVRAWRWRIILRPLKRQTSLWLAFKAIIIGYAMNNLIPRSGELVRPYVMARGESIPMAGTLASVVVERLADVMALAGLIAFSLISFQSRVTSVFPMLSGSVLVALAVMLILIGSVILVFFSERRTEQMMGMIIRPLPVNIGQKIERMGLDFSRGMRGLEKSAILPLIFGTAAIWILYGISMYISLQGFADPAMVGLTLRDAFLLLTLSGIAFTIPTPGATGSYHALISTGLSMVFGVPASIALAYAIATHALSYLSITLVGLIFLFGEGISFGAAKNLNSEEPMSSPAARKAEPARMPALHGSNIIDLSDG